MNLILLLAISVMGADTTMSKPVCLYHTKVFEGWYCQDACPDKKMQGACFNWYADICQVIKRDFEDSSWYAPCKPTTSNKTK